MWEKGVKSKVVRKVEKTENVEKQKVPTKEKGKVITTEKTAPSDPLTPEKSKKKRKKWKGKIIFWILLIGLIGVGYFFRKPINQFIASKVTQVPVLNKVFKVQDQVDPYANSSKEQLIKELESKKMEIEERDRQIALMQEENNVLMDKIKNLQEYEQKYEDFIKQKEEWDAQIAQTDKNLFISQFEKMYPDTAAKLYEDIKIETVLTKEQKTFSSMVANMDEEQAAKALEELITTDPELIKQIIMGMQPERKSLILSNMTAKNAALVIKLVSPKEEVVTN